MRHAVVPLCVIVAFALPALATAQETVHTCQGFIDAVPATITTQGRWCLRQDLSTNMTSGNAITVATNNVTIACNEFKLGGLAAGAGTQATGIRAISRQNITIRGCNIRGFQFGVVLTGSGHVVEDNRFDGNRHTALAVHGGRSTIRRNLVLATGGTTVFASAFGIDTDSDVDVIDNTVTGVLPSAGDAYGIWTALNSGGSISGNRVRGVVPGAGGIARGIWNAGNGRISVRDNDVAGSGGAGSIGLGCTNAQGVVKDNIVSGFATGIDGCSNGGGNVVIP